ncbi:MAG: nicotinate phosphoribosyltransferase [Candidatus Izemoplasmatales bacterium]|jgi:nicotinate phosphoribosyltransferase|nr:nicotinate phosphoribosyltransferase [Candidatus Izemoplasmatales bacterium]
MKNYRESMLTDLYELTMANGYFLENKHDDIGYFDLYYRKTTDDGGYAIFAGLETIIKFIESLKFTEDDITFLKKKNIFSEGFLEYLKNFKFTGDIYSFKEGSVIFPNEPIMTIKAKLIEAQIIETFLLQTINHQSLIATKAARIKQAAKGRIVLEMGARRAHGASSSVLGARSAYIAGIDGTSNVLADQIYGVPSGGTMAHSWVQLFENEYEAFKAYAKHYPHSTTFLVDTYDTLDSGVPNAIKVIKEVLIPMGAKSYSIRIDSGDLTYLAKQARILLDKAGLPNCKIVVSNALDERLINTLISQGAPIDVFGVGERLITAKSDPVFGSVYKLVAIEKNNEIIPKIKISENVEKITTPHFKKVYRIYSEDNKAEADLITIYNEIIDNSKPLTIFDQHNTWKTKTFTNYTVKELHHTIFKDGEKVYKSPKIKAIREFVSEELNSLWDEVKRFDFPHKYYVDLSKKLWDVKQNLISSK